MGKRGETRLYRWLSAFCPLVCVCLILGLACVARAEGREVVHRTAPEYPVLAAKMRVSGTVRVVATIDAEGTVTEAHAIAGHALLRQAAEKAVLRWKFATTEKPTDTNIEVQFQLDAVSAR